MTPPRFAFLKACWHGDIVDQALAGFREITPVADVFDVPGAFELPLLAQRLAPDYDAVICAALVVDGGIYRHDFVANSVVTGLMTAGLTARKPVLSIVLTPHHFQETDHHISVYTDHFRTKGREAAEAALAITQTHAAL